MRMGASSQIRAQGRRLSFPLQGCPMRREMSDARSYAVISGEIEIAPSEGAAANSTGSSA